MMRPTYVININLPGNLPCSVQQCDGNTSSTEIAAILETLKAKLGALMSTVQELEQKFTDYVGARDAIDAQKDAASAEKDTTIAEQVKKLADAAAQAGVDAQTIADFQAGIDDATAKEQAALDALTPPTPPSP